MLGPDGWRALESQWVLRSGGIYGARPDTTSVPKSICFGNVNGRVTECIAFYNYVGAMCDLYFHVPPHIRSIAFLGS